MGEVGCFVRAEHAQNTPHPDLLRSYQRGQDGGFFLPSNGSRGMARSNFLTANDFWANRGLTQVCAMGLNRNKEEEKLC